MIVKIIHLLEENKSAEEAAQCPGNLSYTVI